ncbi:phosphorylase family protein [Streptomyces sp. NPDC001700]
MGVDTWMTGATRLRSTVVILTALGLEYQSVRQYLSGCEVVRHQTGTVFEVGDLDGTPWQVALAELGEGNRPAAIVTEQARQLFSPGALLFVGVAGALKDDVELGDVVIATRVHAIHGGKDTPEGFMARPEGWAGSHTLLQTARLALRSASWRPEPASGNAEGRRGAQVHLKPIAAGDVVLNSSASALRRQVHTHYNDVAAIEMESAGMAHAAQIGHIEALTIRGISDKADGNKYPDADAEHQPRAAAHAAAAAVAVIRQLPAPPTTAAASHTSSDGVPPSQREGALSTPRKGPPLSVRHLLSCLADAPLPLYVLSPAAIASVGIPDLSADRVSADLSEFTVHSVTVSGRPGAPSVPCVSRDAATQAETAREMSHEHSQVCAYAAALLDHAVTVVPDGSTLRLLAPHAMALLWRDSHNPTRAVAAARRVRDAYLALGAYEEGLPLAVQIVKTGRGDLKDDLALGQLRRGCGDLPEAEAVLRQVLARAEKDAHAHGLSLAGRTGPSMRDIFRENASGPFTRELSPVQCDVLGFVAEVQHALGNTLYDMRRYGQSERLLQAAVGLLWRTQGAHHPGRMVAQMHRAKAVVRQRRWEEALGLVHDVLPHLAQLRLDRDSPEDDALICLAHAEVTADIVASLQRGDTPQMRGVGMFPAVVVKWLGRTVTTARPEKLTWDDVRHLGDDAVRACESTFGDAHPHTGAATTVRDRAVAGQHRAARS